MDLFLLVLASVAVSLMILLVAWLLLRERKRIRSNDGYPAQIARWLADEFGNRVMEGYVPPTTTQEMQRRLTKAREFLATVPIAGAEFLRAVAQDALGSSAMPPTNKIGTPEYHAIAMAIGEVCREIEVQRKRGKPVTI